ncbi:MAG: hypothetical protein IPN74_16785 [Haliscomenobacter sp.]|nr:hypothetical protein [Haliscomenobacter sp.]
MAFRLGFRPSAWSTAGCRPTSPSICSSTRRSRCPASYLRHRPRRHWLRASHLTTASELPVYLGKMLSALRSHYDKDFLQQHAVYQKGVGKIDLSKFNWLNFFLKDDDKKELFFKGAEAATDFLLQFDWEQYKEDQKAFRQQLYPENPHQA